LRTLTNRPGSTFQGLRTRLGRLDAAVLRIFHTDPSSQDELPFVDGVRAVAVMGIIMYHVWGGVGRPALAIDLPLIGTFRLGGQMYLASFGVPLFFVLSGFLLSQPWFRADYSGGPKPNLLSYYRRRILRIFPAYYVCLFLLLLLLVPTLVPAHQVYSVLGLKRLLAHLPLMQTLFLPSHQTWGVAGQFWTLTMEVLFYILLPFISLFFLRNRWLVAVPISIGLYALWSYHAIYSLDGLVASLQSQHAMSETTVRSWIRIQLPGQFFQFAIGMALANLYVRARVHEALTQRHIFYVRPKLGVLYFIIGLLLVLHGPIATASVAWRLASLPIVAAGIALMIAGLLFGATWVRSLLSVAPVRLMGIISYSAYLWHYPIIILLVRFPEHRDGDPWSRFLLLSAHVVVLTIAAAIVSYLLVEKPFLLMGRRRPQPIHAEASPTAPASPAHVLVEVLEAPSR
jgi:peptidoglycan/LPS O-acetylase OafA/YrhL